MLSHFISSTFPLFSHAFCIWFHESFDRKKREPKVYQRHALWTLHVIHILSILVCFSSCCNTTMCDVCLFISSVNRTKHSKWKILTFGSALCIRIRCTITTIRLSRQLFMRYVLTVARYYFFFLHHLNLSQVVEHIPRCFCSGFQWNGTQRQKLCVQIEFDPLNFVNVWVRRQNGIINIENSWDLNEKNKNKKSFSQLLFSDIDDVGCFDLLPFFYTFCVHSTENDSANDFKHELPIKTLDAYVFIVDFPFAFIWFGKQFVHCPAFAYQMNNNLMKNEAIWNSPLPG